MTEVTGLHFRKEIFMKRKVVAAFIAALALTFSACGGKTEAAPEAGAGTEETVSEAVPGNEETVGDAAEQTDIAGDVPETGGGAPSEDRFFSWSADNVLLSLSESGREQEELVIPAKCTGIAVAAFQSSAVKVVTFEDDDDLGDLESAFFGASELKEVRLPAGQKQIGDFAFSDCTALETIKIPFAAESIGEYAFSGCSSLKEIAFGESLKSIGENAFENCALNTLSVPEGVESIGMYSFYGNKELTSVTLPSTIKTIDDCAFDECPLAEVHMHPDMQPEDISLNAFGGAAIDDLVVYIGEGSWLDLNRNAWMGLVQHVSYE